MEKMNTTRLEDMSTNLLNKIYKMALEKGSETADIVIAIEAILEDRRRAQKAKYKHSSDERFFTQVLHDFRMYDKK